MCNKKKYLILIIFILSFIFPSSIFAAPSIVVSTFPSSIIAGTEFETTFNAIGLTPDSNYYAKSLGGENQTEVDTWNSSWLQQNDAWASMPVFTSNSEGSASAIIKSRFETTTSGGNKEFLMRIRKTDGSTNYDSTPVTILVNTPTPSPTPTPTEAPTEEPTSEPTKAPTPTPTSTPIKTTTPKPTPTKTPIIESTDIPTITSTNVSALKGLGGSPTPEEMVAGASVGKTHPFFPILLITVGAFLMIVGGVNLYKKMKTEYNSNNENPSNK